MPFLDGGTPTGLPSPPVGLSTTQWILLLASQQLQDATGVKWTPETQIPYLNLALKEIVTLKPEAYSQTVLFALIAGVRQQIPATVGQSVSQIVINDAACVEADGTYALIFTAGGGTGAAGTYKVEGNTIKWVSLSSGGIGYTSVATVATQSGHGSIQAFIGWSFINLIDVTFNMGASGTARGKAIISIPKEKMDILLPDWATFPNDTVMLYAITDDKQPSIFYCFPPQPNGTAQKIEQLVSVAPVDLTAADEPFPLDLSYMPACVDYIVGRALMEETTIPNALQKGMSYMQKFMQDLGLKSNVETKEYAKGK